MYSWAIPPSPPSLPRSLPPSPPSLPPVTQQIHCPFPPKQSPSLLGGREDVHVTSNVELHNYVSLFGVTQSNVELRNYVSLFGVTQSNVELRNYVPLFGVTQSNVDVRNYIISRQIVI